MAACSPKDGNVVNIKNIDPPSNIKVSNFFKNNIHFKTNSQLNSPKPVSIDTEKAYEKVADLEEFELKKLLEEVTDSTQNKTDKTLLTQELIRKEEDLIREESGSGEDTLERIALGKHKRRKLNLKKETSAASRNSTGGSLGSLQDSEEQNVSVKTAKPQGAASRSRTGGSCGNLSRGSFELNQGKRRHRRSRDTNRASTSQREGGSLQNLNKEDDDPKNLTKSGSLNHMFNDNEVATARVKLKHPGHRRQKTSSESSGRTISHRRSVEKEILSEDETTTKDFPYHRLVPSSQSSVCDPVEESTMTVAHSNNDDRISGIASNDTIEEDEMSFTDACRKLNSIPQDDHDSDDIELHSVISHISHHDVISPDSRDMLPTISSDSEVDKSINFNLESKDEGNRIVSVTSASATNYAYITRTNFSPVFPNDFAHKSDNAKSADSNSDKTIDENANPRLMSVKSNINNVIGNGGGVNMASVSPVHGDKFYNQIAVRRRNDDFGLRDISAVNKKKAIRDKRKANKEKDVMPSEKTPGFRGDQSIDAILEYIGPGKSTGSKSKKKNKSKREDDNKKSKNNNKVNDNEVDSDSETSNEEEGNDGIKDRSKEQKKRKVNKKESKLRKTSSVEDLVSSCKLKDNKIKRRVTVDDGDSSLSRINYGTFENKNRTVADEKNISNSDFSRDFYKSGEIQISNNTGEIFLDAQSDFGNLMPDVGAFEPGFEVVSRKKKRSKAQSVSQENKRGGSCGWNNTSIHHDESRRSTFPRSSTRSSQSRHESSSQKKPVINFTEGPCTVHDGIFNFKSQCSSSNNTTSVPHSDDSDSDSSVHSMPIHNSGEKKSTSLPHTSYAKMARSTASRSSKKVSSNTSSTGSEDGSEKSDISLEPQNKTKNHSALDQNFPPLGTNLISCTSNVSIDPKAHHKRFSSPEKESKSIESKSISYPLSNAKISKSEFSQNDPNLGSKVVKPISAHQIQHFSGPRSKYQAGNNDQTGLTKTANPSNQTNLQNKVSNPSKKSNLTPNLPPNVPVVNTLNKVSNRDSMTKTLSNQNSTVETLLNQGNTEVPLEPSKKSKLNGKKIKQNLESGISTSLETGVPTVNSQDDTILSKASQKKLNPKSNSTINFGKVDELDLEKDNKENVNNKNKAVNSKKNAKSKNKDENRSIVRKNMQNEPAVIFTENNPFHCVSADIEFGFGIDLDHISDTTTVIPQYNNDSGVEDVSQPQYIDCMEKKIRTNNKKNVDKKNRKAEKYSCSRSGNNGTSNVICDDDGISKAVCGENNANFSGDSSNTANFLSDSGISARSGNNNGISSAVNSPKGNISTSFSDDNGNILNASLSGDISNSKAKCNDNKNISSHCKNCIKTKCESCSVQTNLKTNCLDFTCPNIANSACEIADSQARFKELRKMILEGLNLEKSKCIISKSSNIVSYNHDSDNCRLVGDVENSFSNNINEKNSFSSNRNEKNSFSSNINEKNSFSNNKNDNSISSSRYENKTVMFDESNYNELVNYISESWQLILLQLEQDPQNVRYWSREME